MSPVRVVFLIPTLDRSGAEKQLTLLASRLPRDEFDPRVIALTRGGPYEADLRAAEIPVTVLGKRFKFDPLAWWKLRHALTSLKPDILHTWLFAGNAYGRLALPRKNRPAVVVSERCVDSWKQGWQLWLDRQLAPRARCVVGNSQSVLDFYRRNGIPEQKLRCIPNGIEIPDLRNVDRAALRAKLKLPADAYVAGYIGRLASQKRVRDLIWATETLRQYRPKQHLVIIGDGPERVRLSEFAEDVEADRHVHFLGHREDALRFLPAFDCFWLASSFEGMSNSMMEAMAAGLPIVATDIPPNRELITHDTHGYLVKVGDGVGFMQFTLRLIDDPSLGTRLGSAGRARMLDEFGVERMVQRHVELYRELLASR